MEIKYNLISGFFATLGASFAKIGFAFNEENTFIYETAIPSILGYPLTINKLVDEDATEQVDQSWKEASV